MKPFVRPLLLLLVLISPVAWSLPAVVDADWVRQHLEDPQVVFLDIQSRDYYRQVHLPRAVSAPFAGWRVKTPDGLRGMLPPIASLEAKLGRLGIKPEDQLVIVATGFGAGDMAASARVFWTLKVLGHEQVAILDGGLAGFASDRRAAQLLTAAPASRAEVKYQAKPNLQLLAGATETGAALKAGEQMVDARSSGEFLGVHVGGENERAGTLPNAVNLPFDWMTENGSASLLPAERLRKLMTAAGVEPDVPQVHFCHTGNRASLTWFAAYALLGNQQAKLYDGSILEWGVRSELPMERKLMF